MSSSVIPRISLRTNTIVFTSIGVGVVIFGLIFRRWIRAPRKQQPPTSASNSELSLVSGRENITCGSSSYGYRTAPSVTSRSRRSRMAPSISVPPSEADLIAGFDAFHEMERYMGKALSGLDLVRNRSIRDKDRADLLSSVMDRLRILETDITSVVQQGGYDQTLTDIDGISVVGSFTGNVRSGTLSVLSDDSFMSAVEEFGVSLDEDFAGPSLSIDPNTMVFYNEGLETAMGGDVSYRKDRSEFCQCQNELEYAAKVWCLRQAFRVVVGNEHNRIWLVKSGRQLLGDLLKHSKQDPSEFYRVFDQMMSYLEDEQHVAQAEEELRVRGVSEIGFWDIVLDFILLDAFDDLKQPPSAIYSVTKNYFLSQSMKYSTISTVIWSMLKAKRQRLKNPGGFIAHFYDISGAISPAITLGFLGTDGQIGELCQYFKEQISQFVVDIFNVNRVRYTSIDELSDDVWLILQSRTEAVKTRLSTELLPV